MAICKITESEAAELEKLVSAYNGACSELVEWLSFIQGEWESAMEDRTDKWKEGEAGQQAQERLATIGAWLDELPEDCPLDPKQLT